MKRRDFITACSALGISSLAFSSLLQAKTNTSKLIKHKVKAKVVVVGGGFGGATAAKYLRILSDYCIDVTLIEPNTHFISCPMSNRVIAGDLSIEDITLSYKNLHTKYGVKIIKDKANNIKALNQGGYVTTQNNQKFSYDKLIVSPGVDFLFNKIEGYDDNKHIHAWKAGEQTLALKKQLQAMPDGGTYIISIPLAPFKCPPGPYERACLVANYFKHNKPRSKVLVLDANPEIVSKPALFKKIWAEEYKGIIDYHANFNVNKIENNSVFNELDDKFSGDVLNIIPPMQAALTATKNDLGTVWCEIDYKTFASKKIHDVYVIGDAVVSAPKMPKSGHIANQQGKYCAYSIVQSLAGLELLAPIYNNTCYSFGNSKEAGHVAAVYKYNEADKNMIVVPNSSATSPSISLLEGEYAKGWAQGIWIDALG